MDHYNPELSKEYISARDDLQRACNRFFTKWGRKVVGVIPESIGFSLWNEPDRGVWSWAAATMDDEGTLGPLTAYGLSPIHALDNLIDEMISPEDEEEHTEFEEAIPAIGYAQTKAAVYYNFSPREFPGDGTTGDELRKVWNVPSDYHLYLEQPLDGDKIIAGPDLVQLWPNAMLYCAPKKIL